MHAHNIGLAIFVLAFLFIGLALIGKASRS
jgi:hypothetical protein